MPVIFCLIPFALLIVGAAIGGIIGGTAYAIWGGVAGLLIGGLCAFLALRGYERARSTYDLPE
jgi:hypothetical protein